MSNTPIQIVDENNTPIGSASKKEVWTKGLLHQVVRITILDETGHILVQKRSGNKELFPGRWDNSAAGHVDAGETYEQAAYRELEEELGIKDVTLEKMGDDYYIEVHDDWRIMKRFTQAYKLTLKNPLPVFTLPPEEVESIEWMSVPQVKELVEKQPDTVTDGLEQIIKRFF